MKNGKMPSVGWMWILFSSLLFFTGNLWAEADSDWIVRLRQSPGTRAAVQGGWTRDGNPIDHPGGFYTLYCDGEEKTVRIPKEDLAVEPNDADYDIRIWWPNDANEAHPFEKISAPGSKTYTHSSPSYEVVFEVFRAPSVPMVSQRGLIIMAGLLLTAGAVVIWRRLKAVQA